MAVTMSGLKSPDSLTTTAVYTLPDLTPDVTSDYVLTYQTGGILQWKNASTLGTVISQVGNVVGGPAFTGNDAGYELWFKGPSDNSNSTLLVGEDASQDETITLPADSGTLALIQPRVAQTALDTTKPLLFLNDISGGTPNLIQLQKNGNNVFIVDNSGNVAVNGGSITTSQSTANIFNATSTINIGTSSATTVNIGASSGTTTVNNNLAVTGTGTFTNTLTASGTLAANGIADIGDGGDIVSLDGTTVGITAATGAITNNIVNNLADAFVVQQGTNKYLDISTPAVHPLLLLAMLQPIQHSPLTGMG